MSSMIYKRKAPLLVFLIPAFLFLLVFLYYPFVQNIINTFLKIGGLGRAAEGINEPWYENYARLFADPYMRVAFRNTLILTVCTVVFQVGIALILALLVDTIRVGAQFFRTVYFFPIVISATALGLMFNLIFLYKGGMVNQLLLSLGALPTQTMPNGRVVVSWLDWKDQAHFLFTMFLPVMWQYVGFYFVILVTGLNNIPQELYEAAALDGASGWARTRFITLPMLRNVLCTCLVLAITGSLKVFDLPWVMFGAGMPENLGWLTGTYMYDQTFNKMNVDYGSTIAVLIVVLGVVLSNVSNRVFRRSEDL
ncbi:MAG: sugar ABC transporter permease [Clostridiales bacterium]|nr:sugar ABC transporter permease [Clostridiales bacterium]